MSLAAMGSCPVCGSDFEEPPKRCPRCDTPHHQDCWEYVPGCAIFACADSARPDLEGWPGAHRLVLRRARLRRWVATGLQVYVLAAVLVRSGLGFGLGWFPGLATVGLWLEEALPLVLVLLVVGLGVDASIGMELEAPEHAKVLQKAESEGDRRLQGAIERRVGSPFRISPWVLTLMAWAGVEALDAWHSAMRVPERVGGSVVITTVSTSWWAHLQFPLIVGILLWISAQAVGSQLVLANRLGASLAQVKKPDPEPAREA